VLQALSDRLLASQIPPQPATYFASALLLSNFHFKPALASWRKNYQSAVCDSHAPLQSLFVKSDAAYISAVT